MATTQTQANNVAVKFRGRTEREMPVESQAQNAAMHAAAEGESTLGIPKKVGKEFVNASHGMKVKRLPKHVRHQAKSMRNRGMISEKAAKKHLADY
jgi:hypothetical protein